MDIGEPVPFDRLRHDTSRFECGSPAQTSWLRNTARVAASAETARIYVAPEIGTNRVMGCHALAAASATMDAVPPALQKQAGRSPLPVVLLARLGVDIDAQGVGLGASLVKDAMLRAEAAARVIGARALLIHAESDTAKSFYLHIGEFDVSPTDPLHLFLSMKTIRAWLGLPE
jgi:hypothetical protein